MTFRFGMFPPRRESFRRRRLLYRRELGPSVSDQRQEFVARLLVVPERAEHGARDRLAVLLLYPAHLHAKMARFNDYAYAFGTDLLRDRFGNLAGHALLNLQPPRVHIDEAGDLAEPEHALAWQIGDVGFPVKWQQVVVPPADGFDVLHHQHFVV